MKALRHIEAKLRRKRDRNVPVEPEPEPNQPPPTIKTETRTNGLKLCDTCTKLLRIVCYEPDMRLPFPPNVAELEELPPADCPFCYLRWGMIPPAERTKLRGCHSISVKFHPDNVGGVITIIYSYPVQGPNSDSYFAAIGCHPCTIRMMNQVAS
jgi:hypothetical protein